MPIPVDAPALPPIHRPRPATYSTLHQLTLDTMRVFLLTILLSSLFTPLLPTSSLHGQQAGSKSASTLSFASNVVNSTLTGATLGAATLGLKNSIDYAPPLRVGVGLGILAGIGLAAYDMVGQPLGTDILRQGTFVTGNNTSVIILVDTFYGAAAGALVGTAITLVANEPFLDGLQYGSSAGALAGFGFGLIDAFALGPKYGSSSVPASSGSAGARLAFLRPDMAVIPTADASGVSGKPVPVLQLVRYDVRF